MTSAADFPLFLFAQPRSGSTLCMRLLNAIDGVFLGGETVNLLWSLREAHAERAKALLGVSEI
jgi:hypothetical protein